MKKATFMGALGAASLLVLSACDESLTLDKGMGTIFPLVDFDPTVVTSRSSRAGSEIGDLTAEDLTLTLTNSDGSVNEKYAYPDFPTDKAFPVGEYTMTATYGSENEEGFEKPAVSGSCTLTVTEGKASKPTIVAKPSKAMVVLKFDEGLLNYMTSVSARLHSAGGTYVEYPATETRPAYLKPGNTTVSVSFTKPNGKEGTLEVASFKAEAQHRYTMVLSLGGDGYGSVDAITVKYDDMLEMEDVTVDISDDILSVPAPEMTAIGFTPGESVTIIEGTVNGDIKPQIQVIARGEIAKAVLTTSNCPSLVELGWPEEVDLCAASGAEVAALEALGLNAPGLTGTTGKMGLLDLTKVLPHIAPRNSALPAAEFTLAVTDKAGKTCDPLSFSVKVERLELTMTHDGIYAGEESVDLNVSYNGPSIADNLTFEYLNDRGVWNVTDIIGVRESRASYVVTVAIPSDARAPLTLRGRVGSSIESIVEINTAAVLTVNADDVFATSAIATVSSDEYDPASRSLELYGSTDNGATFSKLNAVQKGAELHVSGLTPGTDYVFRASVNGTETRTASLTTEVAATVPGGDMEAWEAKTASAGVNKWNYNEPVSPWASNNATAFSKTSSMAKRSAVSSVDTAGEAHNGTAGMVRTIGYGASTTFSSSTDYLAGELTLGANNEGTPFASRPSALSFWVKYVPFNSGDQGYAEVQVLDASGNAIASNSMAIDASADFNNVSLPLSYARGAGKAASVKIRFRSSATDDYLNRNGVNSLSGGNTSGQFTGSYMYIDDVEFAY